MAFHDLQVNMSVQDYTQETVIQDIYVYDPSIGSGVPSSYLIRDTYNSTREWRKKTNGTQQVAPRQDVPYDDYRLKYNWVGHIDCRKESVTLNNPNLKRLLNSGYVLNDFKHSHVTYFGDVSISNPRPEELVVSLSDQVDQTWMYEYYKPVGTEVEDGWTTIPINENPVMFYTKVWVIKYVDISDIADGTACRVTISLEKITPWITIKDEMETLGLQDSASQTGNT